MLKLKTLTLRNFLSVGSQTQCINFDQNGFTLVLGENVDVGGSGSRNGVGKAQPLTAKIKTPDGWTTMGNIKLGDIISTPNGETTSVIGIYPQGEIDTYKIEFIDGRKTECSGEHLWKVWTRKNNKYDWMVFTTNQIIHHMATVKSFGKNVYVQLIEHEKIQDVALPLNPYAFGRLIKSHKKIIPEIYKRASYDQKISLIQGLMDSDGCVSKNGTLSYSTTSPILANDIQEILWSIGAICKISEKKQDKLVYNLSIQLKKPKELVSSKRKNRISDEYSNTLKLRIKDITYIGKKECQCIRVKDINHLYITDDYITTHNSTIVQALCFALFGSPLTSIKKDNLVNKTNNKNMGVTLDFEKDGKFYRIERTRKPNTIKWYVNDSKIDSPDNDEAQGESKWTQSEIERVLGFSHELFKHIVIMSTEVIPFLNLPAKGQRDLIEELLGITQLSNKADQLKDLIKETKELIREEEIRIKIVIDSNEKNQKIINDLEFKSSAWSRGHDNNIQKIKNALAELMHVDIDAEIEAHKQLSIWNNLTTQTSQLEREVALTEKRIVEQSSILERVMSDLTSTKSHSCPTCGQGVHDDKLNEIERDLTDKEKVINDKILSFGIDIETLLQGLLPLQEELCSIKEKPSTYYRSMDEAYNHRSSVDNLKNSLERELIMINPYAEQVETLQNSGIQVVSYEDMNELSKLREHQEFLVKLLTSKDSFIRKKIIDQNLLYLNHRLSHYLEKLNLPHEVRFLNDLSTEITLLGREYDFEQLSTGERKRVILGLSWSFRDVWESMNHHLNLLFVDELLDSGLDQNGCETVYEQLNRFSRDRGKNVFLISHREELIGRVVKILKVKKENGFTQFDYDDD